MVNVWIFQGTPAKCNIKRVIEEFEIVYWPVNRYKEEIKENDTALIWKAKGQSKKDDAGIYSVGRIKSNPRVVDSNTLDTRYWYDVKKKFWGVPIIYTYKFTKSPILRKELKEVPTLKELSILKMPQGTNFKVESNEWEEIQKAINSRKVNPA